MYLVLGSLVALGLVHFVVANNSTECKKEIACGHWKTFFPEDHSNGTCSMEIHQNSTEEFQYKLLAEFSNFIHLKLNFDYKGTIESTRCVVQPTNWIWTYAGYEGARQYLNWPMEYSVWSLGLLDARTRGPMNVRIIVKGNCCIRIGDKNTTGMIGLAFKHMIDSLVLKRYNEIFKNSYFCYKERQYLSPFIYSTCLNVICPFEAIGYRCCYMRWDHVKAKYVIICRADYYLYDNMWWILPFVLGVIFYLYSPLFLFKIGQSIKSGMQEHSTLDNAPHTISSLNYQSIAVPVDNENGLQEWIFESPVGMGALLSRPFRYCFIRFPVCSSRVIRFVYAIMTMSVICLKVALHSTLEHDFVVDSVKQGVPMDFSSVLAGCKLSKENFMKSLGGPYSACCLYLIMLTVILCFPKDFSALVVQGLPDNPHVTISPLTLDMTSKLRYGSRYGYYLTRGYQRMYKTMVLHFVMLLNPKFWCQVFTIQLGRWFKLTSNDIASKLICKVFLYLLVIPIYVIFCLIEIVFCLLYYGIPISFLLHVLLRAYSLSVWRNFRNSGPVLRILGGGLLVVVWFMILFVSYIFTIVFIESFIFISRVVVFTYTGLFANPGLSFGYAIFGFSVLLYGTDSIKKISNVYSDLFERTKSLCKRVHDENPYSKVKICILNKGYVGISKELFQFILDRHRPIRIEIFMSTLKISVLFLVLYVSLSLLRSFKAEHPLTEALSTLFVCFVPKLLKEICIFNKNKRNREFDWALEASIKDFRIMKGKTNATGDQDLTEIDANDEEMSLIGQNTGLQNL